MNTLRRRPPEPAPTRIAGTLKARPKAQEEAPAAEARKPVASTPGKVTRAPRTGKAERGNTPPARPARRDGEQTGKPPRERRGAEGEKRPAPPRPAPARADAVERPRDVTRAGRGERAGEKPRGNEAGRRERPPVEAERRPARTEARPRDVEGVRLSKVMAARGMCSRREADELIGRGWVFVDGRRITELGTRIDPGAAITLAPEACRQQAQRVTILLHKPVGYVSGQPEPGYEPAVALIRADSQFDRGAVQNFHPSQLKGLAPAGRLDIDSTGLLVFTQDGRVARQLIGEDSKVEKEYLVRVEGDLSAEGLALLHHGLELDGRRLRPAEVKWANHDQLHFVLREGRKRQIRRMCELVGLKVTGLKRVRIGQVRLGDLPLGQWRYLREDERF